MDRRSFIKICTSTATMAGLGAHYANLAHASEPSAFARVKLVESNGKPIHPGMLNTREAYVFNYPYQGTPCFLINLGRPSEQDVALSSEAKEAYTWKGGVGPNRELVAFSAICAHQLSYPSAEASVIAYHSEKSEIGGRPGVIVCCAHGSVYDPAAGAKVLHGQARQPLAAIGLEYDASADEIYATGVYGPALFDEFFKAYKRELIETLGRGVAREDVTATAVVKPLSQYSRTVVMC